MDPSSSASTQRNESVEGGEIDARQIKLEKNRQETGDILQRKNGNEHGNEENIYVADENDRPGENDRRKSSENGHSPRVENGKGPKDENGQEPKDENGRGSKDENGRGSKDENGQASKDENGQASKDENGQASKDENGQASKDENGQASKDENGQASKDENGQASKDENGQASKDENGQASKDENGQTSKDESGQASKDESGQASKNENSQASKDENRLSPVTENGRTPSPECRHTPPTETRHAPSAENSHSHTQPAENSQTPEAENSQTPGAENSQTTEAENSQTLPAENGHTPAGENENILVEQYEWGTAEENESTSDEHCEYTSAEESELFVEEENEPTSVQNGATAVTENGQTTTTEENVHILEENQRTPDTENQHTPEIENQRTSEKENERTPAADNERSPEAEKEQTPNRNGLTKTDQSAGATATADEKELPLADENAPSADDLQEDEVGTYSLPKETYKQWKDRTVVVFMAGNSGVGKTAIVNGYVHGRYDASPERTYTAAEGEDEDTTCAATHTVSYLPMAERNVQVAFMDGSGTQPVRIKNIKYYQHFPLAILLVYDVTDRRSFNGLGVWLSRIRRAHGPDLNLRDRCLVIGNKVDTPVTLSTQRRVSLQEAENWMYDNGLRPETHAEMSAKEGINVRFPIAEHIVRVLKNIPGNRTFPTTDDTYGGDDDFLARVVARMERDEAATNGNGAGVVVGDGVGNGDGDSIARALQHQRSMAKTSGEVAACDAIAKGLERQERECSSSNNGATNAEGPIARYNRSLEGEEEEEEPQQKGAGGGCACPCCPVC